MTQAVEYVTTAEYDAWVAELDAQQPRISPVDAIAVLKDALERDPEAMTALFSHRVPCNDALANHPTIQTRADNTVSIGGVINGLFGVDDKGRGPIAQTWIAEEGQPERLIGFGRRYLIED